MLKPLRRLLLTAVVFAGPAWLGVTTEVQARDVVIAQGFDAESLWPNQTTAAITINPGQAIVESLFWIDPKENKLEPLLATGYEMETPTSVIVKLREGVMFTNGEPMNADAAVKSMGIVIDAKQAPSYALFFSSFEKAEKVDDLTMRITLKAPYAALEQALAVAFVVPPKYWDEVGREKYGLQPIGTGPYVFSEWQRDNQLVMTKNENYWGEIPGGIDRLIWKPVADDIARVSGLKTGEYDVISNVPVSMAEEIKADSNLTLVPVDSYRIFFNYLAPLDDQTSPLQDKRVRKAINHAIDKKTLIDTIFGGYGVATNGQVLRPQQIGFDPTLTDYEYDPEKAKALLAEAGYPDGFTLTFKASSGAYAQDSEVPFAIGGMLEKVGIKTDIVVLEGGEYLRQLRSTELTPMGFVGMAPADDPSIMMALFRSTWRYPYYKNPELDKLIDAGQNELDKEKRAAVYREAMQLMYEEAPVLWLYGAVDFYATSAKITNFMPGGHGKFWFYDVNAAD
ncbi:MAG: hypothetical protein KF723_09670 [Rhizobiaceae bacterium]|nr:hypothetical protein [Rhizobiaceae bacterium]